jgi:hypothetical protein
LLHWGSTLKVLGSGLDVEVNLLLTQIDHVAGEQRLAVLLEVCLISIQETIQPWEELLGTVVGVQDDWDAVCGSNGANVVGTGNTASDRSSLVTVGNTLILSEPLYDCILCMDISYLSGEVGGTTLGHLEDDWGLGIAGSLE